MKTNWIALPLLLSSIGYAQRLTAPVAAWEAQLNTDPADSKLRGRLIREYFRMSRTSPSAEAARVGHILWLINYMPEAEILGEPSSTVSHPGTEYEAVKAAWSQQIYAHPTPQTLANAANFFRPLEIARSIDLLTNARAIEPSNWLWVTMLGEMYAFQIVGLTDLNQNGLPIRADPAKANTPEVARVKAMLLASQDRELLTVVSNAFKSRAMIAAVISGQQASANAFVKQLNQNMPAAQH